jgi:four helix bundle protein
MGLQQSLRGIDGNAGGVEARNRARARSKSRMKTCFDHEKLDVYQDAIAFCAWVGELLNSISAKAAAKDQLDRASTSIPLNIAEGNGKFSAKDRARFFEVARGSALESAACLDVLFARKLVTENQVVPGKERLARIVQMLVGLLRKFSDRAALLREDEAAYPGEHDYEHEQEHD